MTPAQRLFHDLAQPAQPAWAIRDTRGNLYGSVPEGHAATADGAIRYFKAKFGSRCPYEPAQLRAYPKDVR